MMKRASLLMLATMFGGLAIASAQDVDVDTDDAPDSPGHQFFLASGVGNLGVLNCGGSFLGIVGEEVDGEVVKKLNLPGEYGAIITEVVKESGADKAGLQKNDVVVGYNGSRVESMAQLRRMIGETPVGRTVDLTIIRNGAEQHVKAELGTRSVSSNATFWNGSGGNMLNLPNTMNWEMNLEDMEDLEDVDQLMPSEMNEKMQERMEELQKRLEALDSTGLSDGTIQFYSTPNAQAFGFGMGHGGNGVLSYSDGQGGTSARTFTRILLSDGQRLGATVQSLSPQLARYFKLNEGESGALVSEVLEGRAAEKGGLKAGDVITAIDGDEVKTPMDVTRFISKKEGVVEVKVIRDGKERTIKVDLGEKEKGLQWNMDNRQDGSFIVPKDDPGLSLRDR